MSVKRSSGDTNNFDFSGNSGAVLPFSALINTIDVSGGTAVVMPIPTGAHFVSFGADGNFHVKTNGTASVAVATDGSGSEINPTFRSFGDEITSISVIKGAVSGASVVTASFYV